MSIDRLLNESQDFSLVLGGPLFQLLRRAHLSDDALGLVRQRLIVLSLFTWLPLLVLSALQGQALGGGVTIPFLLDFEAHLRFSPSCSACCSDGVSFFKRTRNHP